MAEVFDKEKHYESVCERVCATFDRDDYREFIQHSENGERIIHVFGGHHDESCYEYNTWEEAYNSFAKRQIIEDLHDIGIASVVNYLGKDNWDFLTEKHGKEWWER